MAIDEARISRSHPSAMTLAGLAIRNVARNRFRAALTVLAVAIAIVAFLLLRTVLWAWASSSEFASRDRVVTRHKVTFVMSLPKRYVDEVRRTPHVRSATWADWFGGKDPRHDSEFFNTLAVDPATYFSVFDEMRVSSEALEAFQHDRQGAIVGDVLARKLGWSVGDKMTLRSGSVPGDLELRIDGIYTATAKSVDRSTLVFHWEYMNDSVPAVRRDTVGWIVSRVDDPSQAAEVGLQIDKLFDDRDTQTLSQDEHAFNASLLGMFSAVLKALDVISGVILLILTLVLGNTIAMGARERTSEYGVLRAIGFMPGHIVFWVVTESLVMGAIGGAIGAAVGWPFINLFIGRIVEETMGAFLPYFRLEPSTAALGVVVAASLGGAAAAIPAWRASQLKVVDAVRRLA
jgi:putative ABC transport system permease protein